MTSSVPAGRRTIAPARRIAADDPSTHPRQVPRTAVAPPPAAGPSRPVPMAATNHGGVESGRRQRKQITHDINHELGTIMLLASLLSSAPDVGADSRQRARLILGETRWLDQLHRAYEETIEQDRPWNQPSEPIRLDLLAEEIVAAMRLSTSAHISLSTEVISAHTSSLTFWRSLRNVIDNAIRAAGPQGHIDVTIFGEDGWAITQVDDDGPGFDTIPTSRVSGGVTRATLGLAIVQEMVAGYGGLLEIRTGCLGGSCVRMQVPAASP